jgi:type IV pilus biogenesis protein CpaD/CtpE
MVKFEVPVGCKNSQNLSFRMSDPEDVIEQVSVGGIAQYAV